MDSNESNTLDKKVEEAEVYPASLVVVVIDTNPYAWSLLSKTLPLSILVANLLIFINAHLSMHYSNQVAVLASHNDSVKWLYPEATPLSSGAAGPAGPKSADRPPLSSHKYRPFAKVEQSLCTELNKLISSTTADSLKGNTTTMVAGALSSALAYIAKQQAMKAPPATKFGNLDTVPTSNGVIGSNKVSAAHSAATGPGSKNTSQMTSRVLIVSVSGDLSSQYVPVMNSVFAAQVLNSPIDVLKLFGDTVFLQQACDATGGVYLCPSSMSDDEGGAKEGADGNSRMDPARLEGLLQYLMLAFLPDATVRPSLIMPGTTDVDFRAACFCHRKIVDIGVICSVCLSIFCSVPEKGECLTCGMRVIPSKEMTVTPVVVARKRKKKKVAAAAGPTEE